MQEPFAIAPGFHRRSPFPAPDAARIQNHRGLASITLPVAARIKISACAGPRENPCFSKRAPRKRTRCAGHLLDLPNVRPFCLFALYLWVRQLMSLEPQRTVSELKELRALTSDANGAQRVAWTDTWLEARKWFQPKLKGLPVEHHYDAAGNSWTTLEGASEKALLLGGHLDSVPNGGWLDGSLGVLASLEVLRRFADEFGGRPPVTVRLVDWADEEGARFGRSLLGSSAFAGTATIEADRGRTDKDGVRLGDAVARCGFSFDRFRKPPRSGRMPPPTSSCISSRARFWSASACHWASFWGPRVWNAMPSRSLARKHTRDRRLWMPGAMPWRLPRNWRSKPVPSRENIKTRSRQLAA